MIFITKKQKMFPAPPALRKLTPQFYMRYSSILNRHAKYEKSCNYTCKKAGKSLF